MIGVPGFTERPPLLRVVARETPLTFNAMISVMPRAGDWIVLEDERVCEVERAYFNTVAERNEAGKLGSIFLYPSQG